MIKNKVKATSVSSRKQRTARSARFSFDDSVLFKSKEKLAAIYRTSSFPKLNEKNSKKPCSTTPAKIDCTWRRRNADTEKTSAPLKHKEISFELKTENFQRKVQVKTKQEETICTTKPANVSSSKIFTSVSNSDQTQGSFLRANSSTSSLQTIRVSVSSTTTVDQPLRDSNRVSPTNIEREISFCRSKQEETFDRRPLFSLINKQHDSNKTPTSNELDSGRNGNPMLPPKPLMPFRPIIVHKKYQVHFCPIRNHRQKFSAFVSSFKEPIGRFEFVETIHRSRSPSSSPPVTRRISVIRSQTLNSANSSTSQQTNQNENVLQASNNEFPPNVERQNSESIIHLDENSSLNNQASIHTSQSMNSLSAANIVNADDKNEVSLVLV